MVQLFAVKSMLAEYVIVFQDLFELNNTGSRTGQQQRYHDRPLEKGGPFAS
jgi:hypothetical protein